MTTLSGPLKDELVSSLQEQNITKIKYFNCVDAPRRCIGDFPELKERKRQYKAKEADPHTDVRQLRQLRNLPGTSVLPLWL